MRSKYHITIIIIFITLLTMYMKLRGNIVTNEICEANVLSYCASTYILVVLYYFVASVLFLLFLSSHFLPSFQKCCCL